MASGKRITHIIENMLGFSRKNSDDYLKININDTIDKSLELSAIDYDLKKNFDFRNIQIFKNYTPDIPPLVCNEGKIQQVIMNILRNGSEAMQIAGVVKPLFTISTSKLENNDRIRIEIEDNGPGMEEEVRSRIFEPFFTTKEKGKGTGLGLSVSYFIITKDHSGEMEVQSAPELGTKFIITLPIDST